MFYNIFYPQKTFFTQNCESITSLSIKIDRKMRKIVSKYIIIDIDIDALVRYNILKFDVGYS